MRAKRPLSTRVWAFPIALAALSGLAAAEPAPTPEAEEAQQPQVPIAVSVEIEGYELDPTTVQLAVARELGVAVTERKKTDG
jgi:hypothetical protein